MQDIHLDTTSLQIRTICESDLRSVAATGEISTGSLLWNILNMFSRMMYADTQAVEGVNSLIKIISTRCRKIALELLSSRVMLKYCLNYTSDDNTTTISKSSSKQKINKGEELMAKIKPFKLAFRGDCDRDRWAPPAIADMNVSNDELVAAEPNLKLTQHDIWATSHATVLRRLLFPKKPKQHNAESGAVSDMIVKLTADQFAGWTILKTHITPGNSSASSSTLSKDRWFLFISKFRYTLTFVELETSTATTGRICFQVHQSSSSGITTLDSLELMMCYFDDCQLGSVLKVRCYQIPADESAMSRIASIRSDSDSDMDSQRAAVCVVDSDKIELYHVHCIDVTQEKHKDFKVQPTQRKPKPTTVSELAISDDAVGNAGENDDDDDNDSDMAMDDIELAMNAVLESRGNSIDDDATTMDNDDDEKQVHAHTMSAIKQAVKSGRCPAAKAVHDMTNLLRKQPQYKSLSKDELEEESLLLLIRGLSTTNDDDADDTDANANAGTQPNVVQHDPEPPNVTAQEDYRVDHSCSSTADCTHTQAEETTLADDSDDKLKTLYHSERSAKRPFGPASGFDQRNGPSLVLLQNQKRHDIAEQAHQAVSKRVTDAYKAFNSLSMLPELKADEISDNISMILLKTNSDAESGSAKIAGGDESDFKLEGSELMWVHWVRSRHQVVRQVTLDNDGKVVFSMSFAFPDIHIRPNNCVIVVPNVGVPMMKVTKAHRPLMPSNMRCIFEMYDRILKTIVNQDSRSVSMFVRKCYKIITSTKNQIATVYL